MEFQSAKNGNKIAFNFILIVSGLTWSFWIVGRTINVYQSKVVGAMYELLWLPAILGFFSLPILSFYFWRKEKFKIASKFFYLFMWTLLSILILYLLSRE